MESSPGEVRGVDAGPKKLLGLSQPHERNMDEALEMSIVLGHAVSHRAFKQLPDKFIRVKLGGITGEAMECPAGMPIAEPADWFSLMLTSSVPEDNDTAPQVLGELAKEGSRLHGADVLVLEESGVEGQASALRRDRDGRTGRNLGPVPRATQDWRLTAGSPSAPDSGDQKEATLVEKDQMGPKLFGFFLYAARHSVSSVRWPSRPDPGRAWPASGCSNPSPETQG